MSETGSRWGEDAIRSAWRTATAVRVFLLALVLGQATAAEALPRLWVVLLLLAAGAAGSLALERAFPRRAVRVAAAEVLAVTVLLALVPVPVLPLAPYLAAPVVVAGVRGGWRAVAWLSSGTLSSGIAVLVLLPVLLPGVAPDPRQGVAPVVALLAALLAGVLAGLVAAGQTGMLRRLSAREASVVTAGALLGQLHSLMDRHLPGLDVRPLASAHLDLAREIGAGSASVWTRGPGGAAELLAARGAVGPLDRAHATRCLLAGADAEGPGGTALALRAGRRTFGCLLAELPEPGLVRPPWRHRLDVMSVRLDTALAVERIQGAATLAERYRLARDLHDGVAQRLVALGLAVDDLAAEVAQGGRDAARSAAALRDEITGIVGELRFSVFDLRHDVDEAGGLSAALAQYARELSRRSGLRVHLSLDERGPRLPRRTEAELVQVAREAVINSCRHARAVNVWLSLVTDGSAFLLRVEDDGVGGARHRPGHYGLSTMCERAGLIDADLRVEGRADGGTAVSLRSRGPASAPTGAVPIAAYRAVPG